MNCFFFPGFRKVLKKFSKVPGILTKKCNLQNFASQRALEILRARIWVLQTLLNPNMTLRFLSRFISSPKKFIKVGKKNWKIFFSKFGGIWRFLSFWIILQNTFCRQLLPFIMRNAYTLIHSCILDAEWATQSVSIFGSGQPIYIACCLRQQVLSWLVRQNLVSLACHDKSVLSYDALILPCLAYHARLMLHGLSSPVRLMACLAWMVLYGGYLEPSCKSLHHQACHGMYI